MKNDVDFYREGKSRRGWRWRVRSRNGEILGTSTEGYSRRSGAARNAESLLRYATTEKIQAASSEVARRHEGRKGLVFYRDAAGDVRWRIVATNGKIVHASSEGFSSVTKARKNLQVLVETLGISISWSKTTGGRR